MKTTVKTTTITIALLIFSPASTIADTYDRSGLSISASKSADPFQDGWDAYNKGDLSTAYNLWKPLADQGNAAAQNNMGMLYYNNIHKVCGFNFACAAKQLDTSEDWFRKAAIQGLLDVQLNLGIQLSSYAWKRAEAMELLTKVANSNDSELARKAVAQINKVRGDDAAVEQNITESQRMSDEWAQQQQETLEFRVI